MKIFTVFLIILLFSIEINSEETIYEVDEFFDIIYKTEITEEDSNKLINALKQILQRYVYLDILKKPPQPPEGYYYNTVDLIEELENLNKEKRPLYDFYRDVKIIIDKCQDLNLNIDILRNFENSINIQNSLFIFPLYIYILNEKVTSVVNPEYTNYFDDNLIQNLKINDKIEISKINGEDPIEYIQNFNGDFRKLKSPQAQFTQNEMSLRVEQLSNFPFDKDKLTNIKIEYINNNTVEFNYKILYSDNKKELLNKFFEYSQVEGMYTGYKSPFLKPKNNIFDILNDNNLLAVSWDYTLEGVLKCKSDSSFKLNVIYQSSFAVSNLEKGYEFFDLCFESFDKNEYPIVIIESMNTGGYIELVDYFISYLNLNKTTPLYFSMRYNDEVKNNIAPIIALKKPGTCKVFNGDELFKLNPKEDYYGITEAGDKIYHKRTQISDLSMNNKTFFAQFRNKAKNIRKSTDILIFTDGLSYGASSIFIKEIQLQGAAIIAEYGGRPTKKISDICQNPSTVISTDELNDNLSKEIKNLGFYFSYTYGELFDKLDNETNTNIPLEYQTIKSDIRTPLYNEYTDNIYRLFIDQVNIYFNLFKKYCNPPNSKLILINEDCKFSDIHMHGGFECNEDGKWSDKCVPSYCDIGYFLDEIKMECLEEYICPDKEKEGTDDEGKDNDKKNVEPEQKNKSENKNKSYLVVTFISLGLFIAILIIFIILNIIGGFKKKNYLVIPLILFLLLFIIFLLIYSTK